jgi:hypothetical protein
MGRSLVLALSDDGMQASVETFVAVYEANPSFGFVAGLLTHLNGIDPKRTVELVRAFLQTSAAPQSKPCRRAAR